MQDRKANRRGGWARRGGIEVKKRVRAEEAIYIDDVPAYAQAAQRLGMTGIVFQSPEQFVSDLRKCGVAV